jgi:hypothetical protein
LQKLFKGLKIGKKQINVIIANPKVKKGKGRTKSCSGSTGQPELSPAGLQHPILVSLCGRGC